MPTLNSGLIQDSQPDKNISKEEQDLIDQFLQTRSVTQCPPADVNDSGAGYPTHSRITDKRKEYRAEQRAKRKAE